MNDQIASVAATVTKLGEIISKIRDIQNNLENASKQRDTIMSSERFQTITVMFANPGEGQSASVNFSYANDKQTHDLLREIVAKRLTERAERCVASIADLSKSLA